MAGTPVYVLSSLILSLDTQTTSDLRRISNLHDLRPSRQVNFATTNYYNLCKIHESGVLRLELVSP